MKSQVLSRYDIFTVGEAPGVTTEHALDITQEEGGSLNMVESNSSFASKTTTRLATARWGNG